MVHEYLWFIGLFMISYPCLWFICFVLLSNSSTELVCNFFALPDSRMEFAIARKPVLTNDLIYLTTFRTIYICELNKKFGSNVNIHWPTFSLSPNESFHISQFSFVSACTKKWERSIVSLQENGKWNNWEIKIMNLVSHIFGCLFAHSLGTAWRVSR